MREEREFYDILDECLELIIKGDGSIAQCLALYPEYASELEPLLQTALDAKEAVAIKPRPEFRERAAYQFQTAARELEAKKKHQGLFSWQPHWATAVVVVVILLLAGTGTVLAAGNSLPGAPLYQVKLATETVRLALTISNLGKVELYAKLADERVDEIIRMADEGNLEYIESTIERLNSQLVTMAVLTLSDTSAQMDVTIQAEQPMLSVKEVPVPAPQLAEAPRAPAETEKTLAGEPESQPEQVTVPEITVPPAASPAPTITLVPTPVPTPMPTLGPQPIAPPPTVNGAEEVMEGSGAYEDSEGILVGDSLTAESGEQSELKTIIMNDATENIEDLRILLEKVPESARPAILRAIEVADASYERALRNLD